MTYDLAHLCTRGIHVYGHTAEYPAFAIDHEEDNFLSLVHEYPSEAPFVEYTRAKTIETDNFKIELLLNDSFHTSPSNASGYDIAAEISWGAQKHDEQSVGYSAIECLVSYTSWAEVRSLTHAL